MCVDPSPPRGGLGDCVNLRSVEVCAELPTSGIPHASEHGVDLG